MNDENIKRILHNIKECCNIHKDENWVVYQKDKIYQLLDYITNLQQENERLKKQIPNPDNCVPVENQMKISSVSHEINYQYFKTLYKEAAKDIVIDDLVYKCEDMQKLIEANEKLDIEKEDYKSRCEKASEYNNQIIKDTKDFYRPTTDIIYSGDSLIEIATNNINILQNGSDSQ